MKRSPLLVALFAALALTGCNADQLPPGAQYATLKGVVLDNLTSAPIANATVTVDTVLTATTGTDGSFTVTNVPSGDVDYVVTVTGYQTLSDHVHADPATTATISVKLVH